MPLARISRLSSGVARLQNFPDRGPPAQRDLRRIKVLMATDRQRERAKRWLHIGTFSVESPDRVRKMPG